MKPITFTENELDLIAECVLQTMSDLATARNNIRVSDATQSIGTTLLRCQHILDIIAEANHA